MLAPKATNIKPHKTKKSGAGFAGRNASNCPLAPNVQKTANAVNGTPKRAVFQ
jgi:hypothetical protein